MRRELHDSKCAEVAALPNVNEYADVLQMKPGPEKTALLDEILEEKYKIDEEAADRWREEEGLPPLSKEDREAMLDKIMSEDDRKWLEIHKKRQEQSGCAAAAALSLRLLRREVLALQLEGDVEGPRGLAHRRRHVEVPRRLLRHDEEVRGPTELLRLANVALQS